MDEAFCSIWDIKEYSQKLRMKLCGKHKKYPNQYWPGEQQVVQICMEDARGDPASLLHARIVGILAFVCLPFTTILRMELILR